MVPSDHGLGSSSTPASAAAQGEAGIWVFAYGSLMWRPDFEPVANVPARLAGWHRSLCILSTLYRGTEGRPGLVLGLDRGGSCIGRALAVAPEQWAEVKARLDERELPTGVYDPRFLTVTLAGGARVPAYAYVVRRDHWQYWQGSRSEAVRLIRQGVGRMGAARDYLADTLEHLSVMGIRPPALTRLLAEVDRSP